jgi:hypothetical protein
MPGITEARLSFFTFEASTMKALFFFFIPIFFIQASKPSIEKWVIEKNSVFSIEGRSNVAPYQCKTSAYLKNDTLLMIREENESKPLVFQGGLELMIKWFDCGQQFMTKEMHKTLKADKRPELKISIIQLGRFHEDGLPVKGLVDVEIAGITKRIDINFQVKQPNSSSLCFLGTRKLKFADFNLVPPEKLAGLVKVEQEILVKFQINLRAAQ